MDLHKFDIIIPPQDIEQHPGCLKKIAAGDRGAYAWLYKNYCSKLYNYILVLTTDKALSEDIVQDAFLKIWNNKETLTAVNNFNSYLYTTARNLLLDKWRRKQNEKIHLKTFAGSLQQEQQNDFFRRDCERTINAAVKTLSPKQEIVYRMIREEGKKREEVSKELKIAPNTVKVTMQKALAGLRERLGDPVI
jgi:RNA polymerase sigma-70 factor (ECF subfamily)